MSSRASRRARSSRMSVSQSRKRKSVTHSRSRSKKRRSYNPKPSAYTGDLDSVVKRSSNRGAKHDKMSLKLMNQLQRSVKKEYREFINFPATSAVQSFAIASILDVGDIENILKCAGSADTSTRGVYAEHNINSRQVLHLSSWHSRTVMNPSNVDYELDVYYFQPRHDVWKVPASAVGVALPVAQTALTSVNDFVWVSTDETDAPEDSTAQNLRADFPSFQTPGVSLFDINRFTTEFRITKKISCVLAGGESKQFLLKDTKQRVLDTRYFNAFRQANAISLKGFTQYMLFAWRSAPLTKSDGVLVLASVPIKVEDHYGYEMKPVINGYKLHTLNDIRGNWNAIDALHDMDPNDNKAGSEAVDWD